MATAILREIETWDADAQAEELDFIEWVANKIMILSEEGFSNEEISKIMDITVEDVGTILLIKTFYIPMLSAQERYAFADKIDVLPADMVSIVEEINNLPIDEVAKVLRAE